LKEGEKGMRRGRDKKRGGGGGGRGEGEEGSEG
jgi:hypothetical protein